MNNYFSHVSSVIFDVDGVLVDSEFMSCNALNIVFDNIYGIDIGRDYSSVIGKSLSDALNYYLDKYDLSGDLSRLMMMKEVAYKSQASGNLRSFPYCEDFIKSLLSSDYQIGVASSGSLEKIKFSLKEVNLLHYFQHITSASEVSHGKPAPDIFLASARKLGVSVDNCLVIEDSIAGAKGALSAGCKVYGFVGTYSASDFDKIKVPAVSGYHQLLQLLKG